ncbi:MULTISPECIES: DMT family transporter [Mesonia]|uniref:Inner membrane transporter YhbE n=1 Tax=Mesonia oceanica TaxID=2687242 RepID=A0AC61Y3D5_9FLAO|nr:MULTISPECIES: DMT family transporter [Mesonia]MAN26361.1 EamA family transporter [Mesonia sp.]MBJ97497.1 EamA family transporter [Flavobacteriaceae bacterium]VVU98971.1 putative inner membrane transporter YhbE [Mesonia oceanica]|tara:strand:- start:3603 stop:4505 length:903 start_codon:yes stop_codon:yes gene_type:complete
MDKRILAILAAIGASTIYGINHTVAKGVMPTYIQPFGFILLRVTGAAILFWLVSIFKPWEKIERKDWPRLVACAIFGMVINMLFFFQGLNMSTPINSSVITTLSPVMVIILSAFLLKERITLLKISGIIVGLAGALFLVFFSKNSNQTAANIPLGNLFFIVNALSFGVYLIIVKPLARKYDTITLMKWIFSIAVIINFPITFSEFQEVQWQSLPFEAIWKMGFVVVGTTFFTYLLNLYALKYLSASTLSAFIYLQPLIAIFYSITTGADTLNTIKIVAAILVFVGVYMVSKNPTTTAQKD